MASGKVTGIVEEKDASDGQRQIHEVNAGVYVASTAFLFAALGAVKNDNRQGEYYLPDIVAIGLAQGKTIETVQVADAARDDGREYPRGARFYGKELA